MFTVLSFIIADTIAFFGMKVEIQNVEQRVAKIERTLKQLGDVIVLTARQDERITKSFVDTGLANRLTIISSKSAAKFGL